MFNGCQMISTSLFNGISLLETPNYHTGAAVTCYVLLYIYLITSFQWIIQTDQVLLFSLAGVYCAKYDILAILDIAGDISCRMQEPEFLSISLQCCYTIWWIQWVQWSFKYWKIQHWILPSEQVE